MKIDREEGRALHRIYRSVASPPSFQSVVSKADEPRVIKRVTVKTDYLHCEPSFSRDKRKLTPKHEGWGKMDEIYYIKLF